MTAPKNPKPVGLPITMTVSEILDNLKRADELDAERKAKRAGAAGTKLALGKLKPIADQEQGFSTIEGSADSAGSVSSERPQSKSEREAAQFKASYLVGDTTPSKVDLRYQDTAGPMLLEVTQIDPYDRNPRIFENEAADDIRASIVANGYHDALVVTRRREGDRFMLAAGANTTLKLLQELWASTGDEKYRWVNCVLQPFENETKLLAQHLGENLNRGDMKFWEVAKGMCDLIVMIEAELKRANPGVKQLSLRDKAEHLAARGLSAQKSLISIWEFAVQRLAALGPSAGRLTAKLVIDTIQPRLNGLRTLAVKFRRTEDVFWDQVVNPTLTTYGKTIESSDTTQFDANALCDQVDAAFAEHVEECVSTVRHMLSVLKLSPELTLADLRMPSPNIFGPSRGGPNPGPAASGDTGEEAGATSPQSLATQAPLALGPGVVRSQGSAPVSGSSPGARVQGIVAQATSKSSAPVQERPSGAGPLFEAAAPAADPLKALHEAVAQLLALANLSDTLRWRDDMPLGFYIELPDPAVHARKRVMLGSPEHEARTVKTAVWWSLVLMSGQYREGVVPFMDQDSEFFKRFANDSGDDPLHGTDIERSAPDVDEILMYRLMPGPMRAAMQQMRLVEERAAQMFEALPERWRRMVKVQQVH